MSVPRPPLLAPHTALCLWVTSGWVVVGGGAGMHWKGSPQPTPMVDNEEVCFYIRQ